MSGTWEEEEGKTTQDFPCFNLVGKDTRSEQHEADKESEESSLNRM